MNDKTRKLNTGSAHCFIQKSIKESEKSSYFQSNEKRLSKNKKTYF